MNSLVELWQLWVSIGIKNNSSISHANDIMIFCTKKIEIGKQKACESERHTKTCMCYNYEFVESQPIVMRLLDKPEYMPVKYVKPHVKKGGGSYFSRHIQTERNSQRVFTFISVRAFFTHSEICNVLTLRNLKFFVTKRI